MAENKKGRNTYPFLDGKLDRLTRIYDSFEAEAAPLKKDQACEKGCAFCCRSAGSIDITTLEGWQIKNRLDGFCHICGPACR